KSYCWRIFSVSTLIFTSFTNRLSSCHRYMNPALKIALIYVLIGGSWFVFSSIYFGEIMFWLGVENPTLLELVKALFFVLISGLFGLKSNWKKFMMYSLNVSPTGSLCFRSMISEY